jgi:alpha-L-fucosidase 2
LIVDFDGSSEPKLSSPSGHAAGNGIENTVDEDPGSKWCVNNGDTPVIWQMQFPEPQSVVRKAAVADHRRFMDRCQLTLPEGPNSTLPTPDRVKAAEAVSDPALAALYFQFGRYLVVSGSRPDSQLPTNLQGIWAEEYSTPWRGDFHSNINLQMNYWPVESANLSDCHLPLLRFIQSVAKEGEKTAKAYFHAPGWMANHTQNPWYDTAPSFLPACIGPTCGAWLVAQHVWLHYAFTHDQAFLRELN